MTPPAKIWLHDIIFLLIPYFLFNFNNIYYRFKYLYNATANIQEDLITSVCEDFL